MSERLQLTVIGHSCGNRRCGSVVGPFYLFTLGEGNRGLVQVVLCMDCALGVRRPADASFDDCAALLVTIAGVNYG